MTATGAPGAHAARVERLRGELSGAGVDALLVSELYDLRYLTGFTGSHAAAVLLADVRAPGEVQVETPGTATGDAHGEATRETHVDRFFTDFRYATQSAEQVGATFEREIVAGNLLDAVAASLAGGGQLGFDDEVVTVADHARLREKLSARWQLAPRTGLVRKLRAVKDADEIERIRGAAELADEALQGVLEEGLAGRSEREVAAALEGRMRALGAEAASFPTIVASGPHGALPHAIPRGEVIERDVLVTIDWGALLDGYCSDCTRTYATGEGLSAQARETHALVLAAQKAAVAAVRPGPSGRELDAVARAVIDEAGEGAHFGHGLGHGVGMEIHEGPRLAKNGSAEPLLAGNVVTIEPGVYLPGRLGVRIEDLVAVSSDGADVLTRLPKDLTVVG